MSGKGPSDLRFWVSAALVPVAAAAVATGLAADLWDLNEFRPHAWAGYALSLLILLHLLLSGPTLLAYLRRRPSPAPAAALPVPSPAEGPAAPDRRRLLEWILSGLGGALLGWTLGGWGLGALSQEDPDRAYHRWSRLAWPLLRRRPSWGPEPPLYKTYPDVPRLPLPDPGPLPLSTGEAIRRRRSIRNFADRPLSLQELSTLLHHADGITGRRWGRDLRAAPSAGALYPVETYLALHRVEGVDPGLVHYAVAGHTLEVLRVGDLRGEMVRIGLEQEFLGEAALVWILTVRLQRVRWKYGERAYRYALLEAGHIAQNVYLAATALGLGACAVGAFLDDDLHRLLGIDGREEFALYLLAVGRPA